MRTPSAVGRRLLTTEVAHTERVRSFVIVRARSRLGTVIGVTLSRAYVVATARQLDSFDPATSAGRCFDYDALQHNPA